MVRSRHAVLRCAPGRLLPDGVCGIFRSELTRSVRACFGRSLREIGGDHPETRWSCGRGAQSTTFKAETYVAVSW